MQKNNTKYRPPIGLGVFFVLLYYKFLKGSIYRRYVRRKVVSILGEIKSLETRAHLLLIKANNPPAIKTGKRKVYVRKDLSYNKEFKSIVYRINKLKSAMVRYKNIQ